MLRRGASLSIRWTHPTSHSERPFRCSVQPVWQKGRVYNEGLRRCQHDGVPLRKQLKDAAKLKKKNLVTERGERLSDINERDWEVTVGIEIHAQLNTASKLFSNAQASVNASPNTNTAVFDLSVPGSQPILQTPVLLPALRASIALCCQVQNVSHFDRKHYFYHDQPAGFQITQYYHPLARSGHVTLDKEDGIDPQGPDNVTIGIKQVQLEQDTAKTQEHDEGTLLVDFNRVGHPLIEIISLPEIHSPFTAAAYVRKVQALLLSVDAVVTGMEDGGLRADVNVSVRRRGSQGSHEYDGFGGLGQRTEVKNLGTIKAVELAVKAERDRQISLLKQGGIIRGETRGWSLTTPHETRRLRSKEGEVDYRYMPDPDILPLIIEDDLIRHLTSSLPPLPADLVHMLMNDSRYTLTSTDARILLQLDDGRRLDFYQDVVEKLGSLRTHAGNTDHSPKIGQLACNWVIQELGSLMSKRNTEWADNQVTSDALADIIDHLLRRKVTGRTAKQLLDMKFEGDKRSIEEIVQDERLEFKSLSEEEYRSLAQLVIQRNEAVVNQIRHKEQSGKIMFLLGQMVRLGEDGRVEAKEAEKILRKILSREQQRS